MYVLQLEFYSAFKDKYPDTKCKLTVFQVLKPWWVRRLKNWNTCCCKYHQELSLLLVGFNDMRIELHGIDCLCGCALVCCTSLGDSTCNGTSNVYGRMTQLWSSVLCDKEEFACWHRRECLLGDCSHCGVDTLKICPIEANSDRMIKWKSIGQEVVGYTEEGKEKKAACVEYHETQPHALIDYLKPCLKTFILHNYFASRQEAQFQDLMGGIPRDTVISCIDFSENYTMMVQDEFQSMHFRKTQVTILVHITFRLNPLWTCENDERLIIKDVHYCVSDEPNHDTLLVQHAFMLNWDYLKSKGVSPSNHVVWSDGCSGQFKSARAWYFISRYPNLTSSPELSDGCQMLWNYFATGHGKGEVDGAGALFKRELRKEQIKPNGQKLQCAAKVVNYLRNEADKVYVENVGSRRHTNKHFWLVNRGDVDRKELYDCETINGSRGMHQVRSVSHRDPTLIQFRQLSCFCVSCVDIDPNSDCINCDHVPSWALRRLKPKVSSQVRAMYDCNDEILLGGSIADAIKVGENVAVRVDPTSDESFWLMLIDKGVHVVDVAFTDDAGQEYLPGEMVMRGYWYEQSCPGSRTYHLRDDRPVAWVYSHLLLTGKFSMPPTLHSVKGSFPAYELQTDVLDIILDAEQSAGLLE